MFIPKEGKRDTREHDSSKKQRDNKVKKKQAFGDLCQHMNHSHFRHYLTPVGSLSPTDILLLEHKTFMSSIRSLFL